MIELSRAKEQPHVFKADAKKTSSLWIYLYRCSKVGARSFWNKQADFAVEEQIRTLCDEVIQHRLEHVCGKQPTLQRRKYHVNVPREVLKGFYDITDLMVDANPTLYTDIALKLNITLQDERIVCKAYSDFAEYLFSKGINWPLIVSLLAFSGSLAVECSRNGRNILVKHICDWTTLFIVARLKEWIVENGKWEGFLHYFEPENQSSGSFLTAEFRNDVISKYNYITKQIHWTLFLLFLLILFVLIFSSFRKYDFLSGKTDLVEEGVSSLKDSLTKASGKS